MKLPDGGNPSLFEDSVQPRPIGRSSLDLSRYFVVVVHDVAPAHLPQLATILDALASRVGGIICGAVVPRWHGLPLGTEDSVLRTDFLQWTGAAFGEVLQHGYTHRQLAPGLLSFFSGRSNELSGLSLAETRHRLLHGREILLRELGIAIAGFLPPAWQIGHATMAELSRLAYRYLVGFTAVWFANSAAIPLATYSWDWGIVSSLGRVGEGYGRACSRLRTDALPCVAIHPVDVDRGYLPRIVKVIEDLRNRGRSPVSFSQLEQSMTMTLKTVP